ncbi:MULTISPECIES: metallophosphoesterase family protein [Clostridium]|nr:MULTISPECIES: metallophosphoesterase [Clostridium]ADK14491.1 putative metallophosphoesterase [Clostridium ljungdahlii DSM 13528]AGY77708.2 metallophosphoesterase [Clostridium autoethanogenum DSM 10061]RMD04087.1 metallophosphoesterase [Clostridium autoethanogenum]
MKKLKLIVLIILLVSISLSIIYVRRVLIGNYRVKQEESMDKKKTENNTLKFAVLGDVHGDIKKLQNAINDVHSIDGNMDTLILNGDNVDQGVKMQYYALELTLWKNKNIIPKKIIKNIGNHDYFDYSKGTNKPKDVQHFIKMYLDFAGEKSVYHDTWIKGYHFISLGSETGNTKKLGSVDAFLSQNQFSWLKEKLGQKYKKNRPIFVFLHQNLDSSIGWKGLKEDQEKELRDILSSYPEVILFTSHTHILLNIDNVKTNLPFTTAHTGAVRYAIKPEKDGIKRFYNESQGLYVQVNGNKVLIKGRDFVKKEWVFSKEVVHY